TRGPAPRANARDTSAPGKAVPVTCERRGAVEDRAPDSSPAIGAWRAVSVETLHPAEIKHAICVRSFHGMRSFHVVATRGTACNACGITSGGRSVNGTPPGWWIEG